jgi:hypothetical protein
MITARATRPPSSLALNKMEIAGVQLGCSYIVQSNYIVGVRCDLDVSSHLMNVSEYAAAA